MASAVTTSQLDGFFKRVYGDDLEALVPEFAIVAKKIPFQKADKIGDSFRFPCKLTRSQGYTWNGTAAGAGTAFALNDPISLVTREANITGSEFVLRERLSYGVVSRSGGKEESFGPALDEVVLDMTESAAFQREMALLYGGSDTGIGSFVLAGYTHAAPAGVVATAVLTAQSWAGGLWAQMEGAEIDVYSDPVTFGIANEKLNVNEAITITSIDPDTRSLSLSGSAVDLTLIGTRLAIAAPNAQSAFIYPRGAFSTAGPGAVATAGNWFNGLDAIISNTGTLFGISAATYNLWRGNVYNNAAAALSAANLQKAMSRAAVRGLMEDVTVLVSTYTWTDLMNTTLGSNRVYNDKSPDSEFTSGSKSIKFFGVNGVMEIVPHPMVKAGDTFIVPMKRCLRIGSTDITFRLPDAGPDRFVRQLSDAAGFEIRNYFDQGLIITHPARCVKITNIVPTSGP